MAVNDLVLLICWFLFIIASCYLMHCLRKHQRKSALIEKIPGPAKFSTLLGNIPIEIVKHVGSSFESSKDLYQSEFELLVMSRI